MTTTAAAAAVVETPKKTETATTTTTTVRKVCPSFKHTGFSCMECAFGSGCTPKEAEDMERQFAEREAARKRAFDEDNAAYQLAKKVCAEHPYKGPKLGDKKDREIANLKEQITDLNIEIDTLKGQIARLIETSKTQTREKLDVLIAELKSADKAIETVLKRQ